MNFNNALKLAIGFSLIGVAHQAHAITDSDANAALQFNFNNPGARSLAMGGAFLALADDATAAYSNPAGLSNLFRPEFSVEYRRSDYTTVFADQGRLLGEPSGLGQDTVPFVVSDDVEDTSDTLSFISFVYPFEKFTLGAYRHQLADFDTLYRSEGPVTQTSRILPNGVPFLARVFPFETSTDLDIVNWGLSGSYRLTDSLSLGLGISYYDFEFETDTFRYPLEGGENRGNPADFSQTPFSREGQSGDDDAFGFNVGLLWNINQNWSVGLVYRDGPDFDYQHTRRDVSTGEPVGPGGVPLDVLPTTDFTIPKVYGVGVAFRPVDQLTISFDYNRITYSDLTSNVVFATSEVPLDYLSVDDGNEYRLGAEYVFATDVPFALRAGVWSEPDHLIAYNRTPVEVPPGDPSPERNQAFAELTRAALFQDGDDEIHVSFGAGVVFGNFQLDAAVDISDRADTFSLSGVFFF